MTPAELARLKALANAATPGPWRGEFGEVLRVSPTPTRENPDHVYTTVLPWVEQHPSGDPVVKFEEADAAYIAAMHPQTTLALIAEVGRLREAGRDVVSAYTETAFNGGSQAAVALGEAVENMRQTLGEP